MTHDVAAHTHDPDPPRAMIRTPKPPRNKRAIKRAREEAKKEAARLEMQRLPPEAFWPQMWMWDLIEWREKDAPKVHTILRIVAAHYRLTFIELISARRTQALAKPRQIAMYLSRALTLKSLPEIGRTMGGRDHTTILHGARKIARLIENDPALAAEIVEIKRKLGC